MQEHLEALLEMFRQEPTMVNKVVIPKSRIFGSLRSNEKVRVIRSGELISYIISQRQNNIGADQLLEALGLSLKASLHSSATELLVSHVLQSAISFKVMLQSMESPFGAPAGFMSSLELMQINQRENWIYLPVGKVLIAHPLYKKSKNTRKAMKKSNRLDMLWINDELTNRMEEPEAQPEDQSTIR